MIFRSRAIFRTFRIWRGESDSPGSLEPRGVRGERGVRPPEEDGDRRGDGVAGIGSVLIVTRGRFDFLIF